MKIITESEEEKKQVIAFSRYLHDFRTYTNAFSGRTKCYSTYDYGTETERKEEKILERGKLAFLDLDHFPALNYISHLYGTPDLVEVNEKLINLREVREALFQLMDENPMTEETRCLANGLILSLSIMEDTEPKFLEKE